MMQLRNIEKSTGTEFYKYNNIGVLFFVLAVFSSLWISQIGRLRYSEATIVLCFV
jgi:hypothetical protein